MSLTSTHTQMTRISLTHTALKNHLENQRSSAHSIMTKTRTPTLEHRYGVIPEAGTYDPSRGVYLSQNIHLTWIVVLSLFQLLLCFWLRLLIISIYKAIVNHGIDDSRSDSDESDEEEDEKTKKDK